VPNYFSYPSIFVDACESLVMVDDVITLSNLLVAPVEKEEFEKTPLDVNVFQRSREKKPFKKVMRIQINHLA
jgi:hypothetical protein